jgi:vacuolar-type H+-ATPase subunit C/Vma6
MRAFIAADGSAGRRAVIARSHYAKLLPHAEDAGERLELYIDRYLNEYCARRLRMTPPSVPVLLYYLFLNGLETRNLIHAVEAVRYGLSPAEAMKHIVT